MNREKILLTLAIITSVFNIFLVTYILDWPLKMLVLIIICIIYLFILKKSGYLDLKGSDSTEKRYIAIIIVDMIAIIIEPIVLPYISSLF